MKKLADFYINVSRLADDRYGVQLRLYLPQASVDQPPVRGELRLDFQELRQLSLDPAAYGQKLSRAIFSTPDLRGYFKQARALSQSAGVKLRVRLVVDRSAPELNDIRWETLRDPDNDSFLTTNENVYFSRFLFSDELSDVKLTEKGKLSALVVVANPPGLDQGKYFDAQDRTLAPIDVDGEVTRAQEGLRGVHRLSKLVSSAGEPGTVTIDNIVRELRQGHHILYLVCHGALLPDDRQDNNGSLQTYLWLEREDGGEADVVPGNVLIDRIKNLDSDIRPLLIILASCQSAGVGQPQGEISSEDRGNLAALGPGLVGAGIPAVMAMQDNVFMETVAEFMPVFFEELYKDGLIERAMAAARANIQDRQDWWVPTLMTRLREGSIYELPEVTTADRVYITAESAYDVQGLPNPYPGLRSFTFQDSEAYAGRESSVQSALNLITAPGDARRLTFITGASGSGKSSFTQAGLLPALVTHYQARHKTLRWGVFKPSTRPLAMLSDVLTVMGLPEMSYSKLLDTSPQEFGSFLSEHTTSDQVNVVVVDQFEELFTQSLDEEKQGLIEILKALPSFDTIRTHFIATLRSDYLDELFDDKALWEAAISGGVELRAMSVQELRGAIQKPLQAACEGETADERYCSKRFESSLVEKLAQDASANATYLPLLQITLQELWNGGSLKLSAYGDLTAAIRQRAEKVYAYVDYNSSQPIDDRTAEDRGTIMGIFLDLVNVSLVEDRRHDVRQRRQLTDLVGSSRTREGLIQDLIAARLLSVSLEQVGTDEIETVDIIHETLIRNWNRLLAYIDERRKKLKRRARFEMSKEEWKSEGRSDDYLLTGVRLEDARRLDSSRDISLRSEEASTFFQKSVEAAATSRRGELILSFSLRGLLGGAAGFALAYLITNWNQTLNLTLLLGISLFRLVPGAIAGAGLMFGVAVAQTWEHELIRWKNFLVTGLAGAGAFVAALLLNALLNSIDDPLALVFIIIEGALWGFASGAGAAWVFSSGLPRLASLSVVAIGTGLVLLLGELIGNAFQRPNSTVGPEEWQVVLAGVVMTLCIIGAALIRPPRRRQV